MKKNIILSVALVMSVAAFGQDVSIKNGLISIDGKVCLKLADKDLNNVSILDLGGHEIIFLRFIHDSKYGSLYNKITFIDQKLSMTSKSYIFTKKLLIKKLAVDNTISDCKLIPENVEKFVMKYDENVER